MNEHRFNTTILPSRGRSRGLAVTTSQSDWAFTDLFGEDATDGQYYTIICTQNFHAQTSAAEADEIHTTDSLVGDDSDAGEDPDRNPGLFIANVQYRVLAEKGDAYLHVIAANSGTLWIWKSSSSKV